MSRTKSSVTNKKRHQKVLKMAKGAVGRRSKWFRKATETVMRGLAYSYRDRRMKKREFRKLWILRINAAARANGLSYSEFMHGLGAANIEIDRKVLADLAVHDPAAFSSIAEKAQAALA